MIALQKWKFEHETIFIVAVAMCALSMGTAMVRYQEEPMPTSDPVQIVQVDRLEAERKEKERYEEERYKRLQAEWLEKERKESEQREAERIGGLRQLEAERIEMERIEEEARLEEERLEAERIEAERLEAERIAKEEYEAEMLYYLTRIILVESGNQPILGQVAVGATVMNRIKSSDPQFADDIQGTLPYYAPIDWVTDEVISKYPQSIEAAKRALAGEDPLAEILGGPTYFFYNPDLCDEYQLEVRKNIKVTARIEDHVFYSEWNR